DNSLKVVTSCPTGAYNMQVSTFSDLWVQNRAPSRTIAAHFCTILHHFAPRCTVMHHDVPFRARIAP
ncbi:MAG TPA: hypothetical protein VMY39_05715, partial [Planctomycetota bacterium]|nr:hypothetical protein [Planctomycetota bacterium]